MQFKLRTFFILVAVCTIPLVALSLLPHPRSFWLGYDGKRQQAFSRIEIGEPKQHAFELLGEPRGASTYFSREISYRESEFKPSVIAKCRKFYVWNNGWNWFYCVGVDEDGIIVLKADGNS